MKAVNFTPHYVIGVGSKGCFHTLREAYQAYIPGGGPYGNAVVNGIYQGTVEVRYGHCVNLSQDADEAYAKAVEFARKDGIELYCAGPDQIRREMAEIQRASAEEIAAREAKAKAQIAEFEAQKQAELDAEIELTKVLMAEEGVVLKRRYRGAIQILNYAKQKNAENPNRKVGAVALDWLNMDPSNWVRLSNIKADDIGWIEWFLDMAEKGEFNDDPVKLLKVEYLKANYQPLTKPDPAAKVGEVGKRLTLEVEVLMTKFIENGFGGSTLTKMVDTATKALIVHWNSGKRYAEVGQRVKIKATVKKYDDYNGQAQTVVTRVAVA